MSRLLVKPRSEGGLDGAKDWRFSPLLQVFDMPTSIAFYREILGFELVSDVPEGGRCDFAMLKLHESELMLNTASDADDCEWETRT